MISTLLPITNVEEAFMCGFGGKLLASKFGLEAETRGWTANELCEDLERLFSEIEVSLAARQCHFFDLNVIIGEEPLEDKWLSWGYNLLGDSCGWEDRNFDEQKNKLQAFKEKYRKPSS